MIKKISPVAPVYFHHGYSRNRVTSKLYAEEKELMQEKERLEEELELGNEHNPDIAERLEEIENELSDVGRVLDLVSGD